MEIKKANKTYTSIKMAIQGPAGSGKTYSALLVAKGLAKGDLSKVAIIDTEGNSAHLYAGLGDYSVLSIKPPYNPEKYKKALDVLSEKDFEVIIIDSISHAWENLLNHHAGLTGNSFANWAHITPRHNDFVQAIMQSNKHILCTMRTKQHYVLNLENGKYVPKKVGTKPVQRDGIDYEFTLVSSLDMNHAATFDKDRTRIFAGKPIAMLSELTGSNILVWCKM